MANRKEIVCKVVLLGESGVGKTSIITRYIANEFAEGSACTTSASYATKTIQYSDYQNKEIKFEIWDTVGQEKYRALNQLFYKDAAICVLVYDITSEHTYDAIEDYWYDQVTQFSSNNVILGIAGNKCDLMDAEKVSEERARNFANEKNAIYERTSACQNIGIDNLFYNLGLRYLNPKSDESKQNEVKSEEKNENGKNDENNNTDKANTDNTDDKKIKLTKDDKDEKINNKKKKKCCH